MAWRSMGERRGGVPPARRDFALIVAILIAIDAVAAWLLVNVYFPARRDEAFGRARAQLSLVARDRQNALAGWVRERLSDAELMASLLAGGREAAPVLDQFIHAYRYESAFVLDAAGAVKVRRGSAETDDATIADFLRSRPKDAGAWIDFRRTAKRAPKILTACRTGASTVVFVSDPYDYVYPLFATFTVATKSGETNLIGFVDEENAVGLNPYPEGFPPPMTVRRRIPKEYRMSRLAAGEQTFRMIDRDGIPVIGVVKTIPRTPWVVFAKEDDAEVSQAAIDETVRFGEVFALVSLMLAAMAFIILRSRRVHQLRAAEDQLARLFANTTAGIVVLRVLFDDAGAHADHQVVDLNPAAEQTFGVVAAEEVGKRSADAQYLQWPADVRARNYEVALTGRAIQYSQYDPASQRWFDVRTFSPRHGQFAQLLTDITERQKSEEAVRNLSARLLRVQDETRRRMARELHETVAQSLAALRMNLGMIKQRGAETEIVDDSITIANDALSEVRTMSYLLHPPMIEHAGVVTALRWYVKGFQQRSGIATELDVPDDLGRLPQDVETSVFRIIQECLTNVQRHSGSDTARVSVERDGDHLSIEVADSGRGLPPAARDDRAALLASGVGIAGINERVHELRGTMDIRSSDRGTTVAVTLPI